ncbi:MAG: stalk domain-containing protein [Candidatus Bruticola sp.]
MHDHYRRLSWPLLCLVLLFTLTSGISLAQQAQINPDVLVNGVPLERSAVIGSTGNDIAVKASPLLRASGASVEFDGQKLEASWSSSMLTIVVGQTYCIYNGQQIPLQAPSGLYENDLVVQLNEICAIIKAQITNNEKQIIVKTDSGSSGNATLSSVPLPTLNGRVSAKNAYLSSIQNGGNVFGMPPLETLPNINGSSSVISAPDAMDNPAFPEAGLGGLSSKNAKSSPYERPVVSVTNVGSRQITTEQPRTIEEVSTMHNAVGMRYPSGLNQMYGLATGVNGTAPTNVGAPTQQQPQPAVISYSQTTSSAQPSSLTESSSNGSSTNSGNVKPKPANPEIVEFDVLRQMSFFLTAYEIKATIRNTGELAVKKPFMVKFMVKSSKRGSHWEVVEDYLINPLAPGQQVEISKRVDGHQYACLMDLSIDFKASVVEEVEIPLTDRNGRNWKRSTKHSSYAKQNSKTTATSTPSITRTKETCSREKNMHF